MKITVKDLKNVGRYKSGISIYMAACPRCKTQNAIYRENNIDIDINVCEHYESHTFLSITFETNIHIKKTPVNYYKLF